MGTPDVDSVVRGIAQCYSNFEGIGCESSGVAKDGDTRAEFRGVTLHRLYFKDYLFISFAPTYNFTQISNT